MVQYEKTEEKFYALCYLYDTVLRMQCVCLCVNNDFEDWFLITLLKVQIFKSRCDAISSNHPPSG